jgi:hypothetical protein
MNGWPGPGCKTQKSELFWYPILSVRRLSSVMSRIKLPSQRNNAHTRPNPRFTISPSRPSSPLSLSDGPSSLLAAILYPHPPIAWAIRHHSPQGFSLLTMLTCRDDFFCLEVNDFPEPEMRQYWPYYKISLACLGRAYVGVINS